MAAAEELIGFVRAALAQGASRGDIEAALRQAGWTGEQIGRALSAFAPVDFPVPVPRPRASLSARDAFLYLLLFASLYVVAFNLGSLIFDLINHLLPDAALALAGAYTLESIRWSISSLIVALPVFLYLSHLTSSAATRDPGQRLSPVRRWLTYLTLFLAAAVLIGDVTTLVYNALGGELTLRFTLKVVTVGAIAGTIFWYYLSDLHSDEREA